LLSATKKKDLKVKIVVLNDLGVYITDRHSDKKCPFNEYARLIFWVVVVLQSSKLI
jgi:hypothetical protein